VCFHKSLVETLHCLGVKHGNQYTHRFIHMYIGCGIMCLYTPWLVFSLLRMAGMGNLEVYEYFGTFS